MKGIQMSKKLMLLAAGALTALAFTALPSAASAGEWENHCTSLPCTFSIQSTGHTVFSTAPDPADGNATHTVTCTSTTGSGSQANLTSSTQTVQLLFHGCSEQDTFFHFSCNSAGQPNGTVTTNVLTSHNIWIDAAKKTPGVILTNNSVTFTCAGGFSNTTVTGNIVGELENFTCGKGTTSTTTVFNDTGVHGQMAQKTITGVTAPGTELEANPEHSNGGYVSSAQRGTGHLNWNQTVTPTC
jgi:hypothetical protein